MSAIYYQSGTLPVMTLPKGYTGTPADEKTLQQLNQDYRRIWFIPAAPDFWDPEHYVEKYLTRADDREIDTRVAQFGLKTVLDAARILTENHSDQRARGKRKTGRLPGA